MSTAPTKRPIDPIPAEFCIQDCQECGKPIFFARTPTGANMPLESKPLKVYTVGPLAPGETQHSCLPVTGFVFLPHWSNCKGADRFRKERR